MSVENFFKDLFSGNFSNAGKRLVDFWHNDILPEVNNDLDIAEKLFMAGVYAAAGELGKDGMAIVTAAVAAAEQPNQTGTQKLASAQASIASSLTSANIQNVAQSTINVAIEAAVSQLKALTAANTAAVGS